MLTFQGAAVIDFSTQTPEDMNSSDEEHTDEENQITAVPRRSQNMQPESSDSDSDSSSGTEEWDSEAGKKKRISLFPQSFTF